MRMGNLKLKASPGHEQKEDSNRKNFVGEQETSAKRKRWLSSLKHKIFFTSGSTQMSFPNFTSSFSLWNGKICRSYDTSYHLLPSHPKPQQIYFTVHNLIPNILSAFCMWVSSLQFYPLDYIFFYYYQLVYILSIDFILIPKRVQDILHCFNAGRC